MTKASGAAAIYYKDNAFVVLHLTSSCVRIHSIMYIGENIEFLMSSILRTNSFKFSRTTQS